MGQDNDVIAEIKSNVSELQELIRQYNEIIDKIKNFNLKTEVITY